MSSGSEELPPGYSQYAAQPAYAQSTNFYNPSSAGYYTQGQPPVVGGQWGNPAAGAGYKGCNACCCCTVPGGGISVAITDIVLSSIYIILSLLLVLLVFAAVNGGNIENGAVILLVVAVTKGIEAIFHIICIAASITVLVTVNGVSIWAPIFWFVANGIRFLLYIIDVTLYYVGTGGRMIVPFDSIVNLVFGILYIWFAVIMVTLIQYKKHSRNSGNNALAFSGQ